MTPFDSPLSTLPTTAVPALERAVMDCLKTEGVWQPGRLPRVMVAYSGGADSTALLHAASRLQTLEGVEVVAAYFDHGWRGRPSPELPLLHKTCLQLRVPLFVLSGDVNAKHSEALAREQRYMALGKLAKQLQVDTLLTAHHSDDQVETLLFRLFRGTGLDGLSGIRPRRPLKALGPKSSTVVLRPFLQFSRSDVEAYLQHHELGSFQDPSNTNTQFVRNALRHELIPRLKEHFPQLKQSLLRLGTTVTGELHMLTTHLNNVWDEIVMTPEQTSELLVPVQHPCIDTSAFCQLGRSYQRRILRRLLMAHGLTPDFAMLERALAFITGELRVKKPRPRWSLGFNEAGQQVFLVRLPEALFVEALEPAVLEEERGTDAPPPPEAAPLADISIELPAGYGEKVTVDWPLGGKLTLERIETLDARYWPAPDELTLYANFAVHRNLPLKFRTRMPGDRITPLGLNGTQTRLKKYFNTHKIKHTNRARLPLLVCEKEVLWVPGVGLSHYLALEEETPRIRALKAVYKLTWAPHADVAKPVN